MTNSIRTFLKEVNATYKRGQATEHSYRSALETLLESLSDKKDIKVTNEPQRIEGNAPDLVVQRGGLTIGHVEAKNLSVDLNKLSTTDKAQQTRYLSALPNLIYTNCLVWQFYRHGEMRREVKLATLKGGKVESNKSAHAELSEWLAYFLDADPQEIANPKDLAECMARRARIIKQILGEVLAHDKKQTTSIGLQHKAFQDHLIDNLPKDTFAEIYAETIVYGMFSARLHYNGDPTKFTRAMAYESMPRTNPFLRNLFKELGSDAFDHNLKWIVDDLAKVFASCDLYAIMHGKSKKEESDDPFIHFYETFLAAYNPAKRKSHGVWYTPKPVVDFIVRAVDEVLKSEFGIAEGLANNKKIDWATKDEDGKKITTHVHRVQILDPATGTGTFLAEACKHIIGWVKKSTPNMVSDYITNHLIPRLHGFEVMMAPYAMCHNKLDMTLADLGYTPPKNGTENRLSIFLTDTLEERKSSKQGEMAFAQWLLREAEGARKIKRDTPIMCVIGNPPYLAFSKNQNPWIDGLVDDYKKIPPPSAPPDYAGDEFVPLGERRQMLGDDYVKFIRAAEHFINKTGEGVLGFITNHAYLDNITFPGMRWHLLKSFDKIYVIDLHGNTRRGEVAPDGKPDKNVFDIQQGVAITIAVKTKKASATKKLADVYRGDVSHSDRLAKFKILAESDLATLTGKTPIPTPGPNFFFTRRSYELLAEYEEGFKLTEFMPEHRVGIMTSRDQLVTDFTKEKLTKRINRFLDESKTDEDVRAEFFGSRRSDTARWLLGNARINLRAEGEDVWRKDIIPIDYRLFDKRQILYRNDMVERPSPSIMPHMIENKNNIGLVVSRMTNMIGDWQHVFVTNSIISKHAISDASYLFPLNIGAGSLRLGNGEDGAVASSQVNFNEKLAQELASRAKHPKHGTPDEYAMFDYIYGVLHCPSYRQKHSEWLKVDFPRIPFPKSPDVFWRVSKQGTELRQLHLMESATIASLADRYAFGGEGNDKVEMPRYNAETRRIYINKTQYFADVPELAWGMYIGGYQPAQAWLKSRKDNDIKLDYDAVQHYRRILAVLVETDRIMQGITLD